jgi:ethanolamine utilization protein EutQ (cupin superfamily)
MGLTLLSSKEIVPEAFDVGPDSAFRLVDVVDRSQGAPFCAGFCEVLPGAPIEFEYFDHHAVCYMLEGEITLTHAGESHAFLPGDLVYIPERDGQRVSYSTGTYGKMFYVTYPHWR